MKSEGKSVGSSKQGDTETITVIRDTDKLAKENLFSGGLLGKISIKSRRFSLRGGRVHTKEKGECGYK